MKKKLLSHYTKLESAKGILGENPNFWFAKISGQNDIQERNLAENFLKKHSKKYSDLYSASFCRWREYIPRYKIYGAEETSNGGSTNGQNINPKGDSKQDQKGKTSEFTKENTKTEDPLLALPVMICFTFKDGLDYSSLFSDNEVKGNEIHYCKQKDFKKYLKEPETIPDDEIGFIKSNYWKYEKEYRFCWKGVPLHGDKREIFINLESLEKIEIFYFPTEKVMEVYKKEDLRKLTQAIRKEFLSSKTKPWRKGIFHVHRSALYNVVRLKKEKNN